MRIECLYVSKLPIFSAGTLDTMLRSLAIGQLGRYGDPDMIAESHRKFDDHISEKDPIPADYKTAVFSAVLGNGEETHFDKLVEVRVGGQPLTEAEAKPSQDAQLIANKLQNKIRSE